MDTNTVEIFVTGLEQEQQSRQMMSGELVVPELKQAALQMAADGIVLLKNDRGVLPLKKEDTVAVFGRCAINYFTVGYGSGGDVVTPYRSNLMEGLQAENVAVEETLAARYRAWCAAKENIPDEGEWGRWPMNYPEMPIEEDAVCAAAKNSTVALVVIGRAAGEDRENLLTKGSFYLTDEETALLDRVTAHFDQVVVIMDCGNVIDMGWTEKYGDKLSAVLYAWQGGMESGYALAQVLTGKVNPSARLADTIARTYEDYPSSENFGNLEYNNYAEDIYVGYRYFETFCKDKVLYPFGFGLSYTTFDAETRGSHQGKVITLESTVKNVGDYAGREVVQAYLKLPQGKLGNPRKVLAAFGKTPLLQPGESCTLKMQIDLAAIAPYDDAGKTGYPFAHVLEAGIYTVAVGKNVRDTKNVLALELVETQVVRQLTEACPVKPDKVFDRMVNKDGQIAWEQVPAEQKSLREQILRELPAPMPEADRAYRFDDVVNGVCTAEMFVSQLTEQELDDIAHGEGKMDSPLGVSYNAGAFGGVTEDLRSRGIPPVITTDGPSGIRLRGVVALLPCGTALASSFDPESVEKLYALVAQEMDHYNTHMLLGPGMNIHRNPLCGRNFEYFSEDPFLTGKMGAAAVRGVQALGRSACPKHYACNNQESNRNYNDSRVSERALREIYLRGFEMAVREGKPLSIMTSYNKINGVWGHYHYPLVTQVLRQEWGYNGVVITDWWMRQSASPEFPNIRDDAYRVRAQVDVLMPGEIGDPNDPEARAIPISLRDPDGLTLAEAQRSALNVVNFAVKLRKNGKL